MWSGKNLLDVEANGGDSSDDFTELKFVKDRSFTGGIESDHKDTVLLFADKACKNLRKC